MPGAPGQCGCCCAFLSGRKMSLIQCDHVAVVDESHSFVVPWCCQGMEQEGRGESWGSGAV